MLSIFCIILSFRFLQLAHYGVFMKSFRAVYNGEMKASSLPFIVHVIGHRMIMPNMVNSPKGTPCYFIHIFHEEVESITLTGIQKIPANTFIVYEPGKPLYHGCTDHPWVHSWIRCSGCQVASILKGNGIPFHTPIYFDSPKMNLRCLLDIHSELHHPKGTNADNVKDLFKIWMRNVRREALEEQKNREPTNFLKAKQYIERNCLEVIVLDDIAEKCGVSKSHLCKGFRQHFEMSPLDYAIKLRMQLAVELLDDINLNISQIAERCGYHDIYYFSRSFKQHMGTSPSQFRKNRTLGKI